jgi:bifunctional DNA-binding transcriptional regulator/antitoxin component of YhaV-PrlF toxin-antitoxin module
MQTSDQTSTLVRVLHADEIAIPVEFREALGIDDSTTVFLYIVDGELRIKPIQTNEGSHSSDWLQALYDYYAPVREEILACGISEEEVNADIDAAIAAVRAEQRARRE